MDATREEPRYLQLRSFEKALNADVTKKAAARNTTPSWIKSYCGQLEDPEYVSLSLRERGFLNDLRLLAARRGNKLPNDPKYVTAQLRCSSRTATAQLLHTLRAKGFLEPYNPATNDAANQLLLSHPGLEPSENGSRLEEIRKREDLDLSTRPKPHSAERPTSANGATRKAENLIRNGGYEMTAFSVDDELVSLAVPEEDKPALRTLAEELRSAHAAQASLSNAPEENP